MFGCGLTVDRGAAFDKEEGRVVVGGGRRGELGAGVKPDVGDDDGGIGLGGTSYVVYRASDDVYLAAVIGEFRLAHLIGREGLVVGRRELVLFGKIDPELHHFEGATPL